MIKGMLVGSGLGVYVLANDVFWHNVLHFARSSWLVQLSFLLLGHPMRNIPDNVMGVIFHLVFGGILGATFARVVLPRPGEGDYLLRGLGFGVFVWFASMAVGTIFKIPKIYSIAWQTAVTQLWSAASWGLLFGWLFKRWDVGTTAE